MGSIDSKLVLDLIEQIYDAAIDPTQWYRFMRSLGDVLGGPGTIFVQDSRTAAASMFEQAGFGDDFMRSYVEYYSPQNCWLPRIPAHYGSGSVVADDLLIDPNNYEKTEFYNEWVKPQDIHYCIGGIVLKEDTIGTNISFLRPKRAGPFAPQEIDLFRTLLPHVQRAIQIHRHVFSLDIKFRCLQDALDRLSIGAIIVDAQCRLLFANACAEKLLKDGDALTVTQGRLSARVPAHKTILAREIRQAATGGEHVSPGTLAIERIHAAPLSLVIAPVPRSERSPITARPLALVLVGDPAIKPASDWRALMRIYGLTTAEARLLAALVAGQRLTEYAEATGVSANTVKTHLKQIFAKTGTDRQAELLRLVLVNPIFRFAKSATADT